MRTLSHATFVSLSIALGAALTLSACGDGATPEKAPAPAPTEAPAVPASDAPPPAATEPALASGALPLTPGVYVGEGVGCGRPPSAGFRIYDGRGISGSSTSDCRAVITSSAGSVHQVDQSCEDTYSGRRSSVAQTVAIPDARTFTLTEGGDAETFRLCPAGEAPSYLEDLARP